MPLSALSNAVLVPDTDAPAAPSGLAVAPDAGDPGGALVATWADPADADLDALEVEVGPDGSTWAAHPDSPVAPGVETVAVAGLAEETTRHVRVRALDAAANASAWVTASGTTEDTTAPADVTGLTATPGDTEVVLAWTDPADADLAGVRVYRRVGADPFALVHTAAVGAEGWTDTGRTNGTTYDYDVRTIDEVPNESAGVGVSATPESESDPLALMTDGGTVALLALAPPPVPLDTDGGTVALVALAPADTAALDTDGGTVTISFT